MGSFGKSVCLLLAASLTLVLSQDSDGIEDVTATECNDQNVTTKYSICFTHESNIVWESTYRSERQCLDVYEKVARCIEWLGAHCDNGIQANYMRFLYHEYNIRLAGQYACQNLPELRTVIRCVSSYGDDIVDCRYRIWYGAKMAPYLAQASKEEEFCWNMGVAVHCRHLYARYCPHHQVYFKYLFSVYPMECQDLPWAYSTTTTTVHPEIVCSIYNYVEMFSKCFSLENAILTDDVNSTKSCNKTFMKMRACTDKIYYLCKDVKKLGKLAKDYASPDKMRQVQQFVCDNLEGVQLGGRCVNRYQFLIKGCTKTLLQYESVRVEYLKKADPEQVACLVITADYRCRRNFFYKCPDSIKYYAEYLYQINPKCLQFTTPTALPEIITPCNLVSFTGLYTRCLKIIEKIVLEDDIYNSDCSQKFYKLTQCITDLKDQCEGTDAEDIAADVANTTKWDDADLSFMCNTNNFNLLKLTFICLENHRGEINECLKTHKPRNKSEVHVCEALEIRSNCQRTYMSARDCPDPSILMAYIQNSKPRLCSRVMNDTTTEQHSDKGGTQAQSKTSMAIDSTSPSSAFATRLLSSWLYATLIFSL